MAELVAWLWQGMALAAGVAVLVSVARALSAATRYVLWLATLAAVLALPFAPAIPGVNESAPPPAGASAAAASTALVEPLVPLALPAPADWLIALALGVWLGFLLLGLLSLWRAAAYLGALRRSASPIPDGREARLPLWLAARGSGRAVALAVSDEVAAPAALGLGRAIVLLPRALVDRLADDELDQIVLHEYGHLRRRDDWARLAQALIQSVAWFHPAVWWIDRQLELEREAACDDFVVRQTGAARRYAACLAHAAELVGSHAYPRTLAPGMAASRQVLLARVGRLLDERVRRHELGLASFTAGFVALAVGVGALAQSRPLVAVAVPVALASPAVSSPAAGIGIAPAPIAPLGVPVLPPVRRPTPVSTAVTKLPAEPPALAVADSAFDVPGVLVPVSAWTEPASPTLAAAPLVAAVQPVAAPESWPAINRATTLGGPDGTGPWDTVAGAGSSVGSGLKKASVATAGFFTRLGRSIASSF